MEELIIKTDKRILAYNLLKQNDWFKNNHNALKMLGIGVAQDILLEKNFIFEAQSFEMNLFKINSMFDDLFDRQLIFWNDFAYFNQKKFYYSENDWIEKLIKEIN